MYTVTEARGEVLRKTRRIYLRAFPKSERMDWGLMLSQRRQGHQELLCIKDGRGAVVGMAATILHGDLVFINYLAIDSSARCNGAGSRTLELMRLRYPGKRIFLNIEAPSPELPDNAIRLRRRGFYLRGGLSEGDYYIRFGSFRILPMFFSDPVCYGEYREMLFATLGPYFAGRMSPHEEKRPAISPASERT